MWKKGAGALCLTLLTTAVSCASVSLSGVIARTPLAGEIPRSWWLSKLGPETEEWKNDALQLSKTRLELFRIDEPSPLEEVPRASAKVNQDGSFEFHMVESGEYLLRASHKAYRFPTILVTVTEDGKADFFKTDPLRGVRDPVSRLSRLLIRPERFESPYPDPEPLNVYKYLKNPISIMLLGTLFVSYVLPSMTEGVDMESLREEQGTSAPEFKSAFVRRVTEAQFA